MSLYRIPVQVYCESFLIAYSETGDERYLDYLVEDTLLQEEIDLQDKKWKFGVTHYDVDGKGTSVQTMYKPSSEKGKYLQHHHLWQTGTTDPIEQVDRAMKGIDVEELQKISKEWQREPKGWIASKIRWLRQLYSNILGRLRAGSTQKEFDKSGFFGKVKVTLKALASKVLGLIDRMAAKLEHWTDNTENKDELKKSGKSDKLFKSKHELVLKSVMQTAKDNNLVKENK
jgi:hypothetical protein